MSVFIPSCSPIIYRSEAVSRPCNPENAAKITVSLTAPAIFLNMLKDLIEIKDTDRKWHLPLLAGICVGLPLFAGYCMGDFHGGKLASMGGLSILYIQSTNLARRMMLLITCALGIVLSFTLGLVFSFNPYGAAAFLTFFVCCTQLLLHRLRLSKAPGNFFFVMLCSMALCMPYSPAELSSRITFISTGVLFSCLAGFVYSLLTLKDYRKRDIPAPRPKSSNIVLIESVVTAVFIGISLLVANMLKLENPYWVPTSCAAVMQGANSRHVQLRTVQRIGGTLLGVSLAWLLLQSKPSLITMCIEITLLQFIVEYLVVRNYGLAVIFISVLAVFLGEAGSVATVSGKEVFMARLLDIAIGSVIGVAGGWIVYDQRLRYQALHRIRRSRRILLRLKGH